MDYEKLYKETLERLRTLVNSAKKKGHIIVRTEDIEDTFPELKESEDEKIRKELKRAIAVALDYSYFDKETADNCIAWIENL